MGTEKKPPRKKLSPRRVIPPDSPPAESIEGILLLLEEQSLSPAITWYVKRLSEVYAEIVAGKSPKVKLEILQELRDFIIPTEDRVPHVELHDPAADDPLRMTGTEE